MLRRYYGGEALDTRRWKRTRKCVTGAFLSLQFGRTHVYRVETSEQSERLVLTDNNSWAADCFVVRYALEASSTIAVGGW